MKDLRERVAALSPTERRLLTARLDEALGRADDARHRSPTRTMLIAYAEMGTTDAKPDGAELRAALAAVLPEYMVPAIVLPLESLPRTSTGKIDRAALPDPHAFTAADRRDTPEGPRTDAEETLASIWADVLGLDSVGVHENFFELGGDSILSIRIIARANDAGLRVTPRQFFESPTVAELASVAVAVFDVAPDTGPTTGDVPLTPIQHWFFEHVATDPHHWNQGVVLAFHDPVDAPALERALAELLAHHAALGLSFTKTADGWAQTLVLMRGAFPLEAVDASATTDADVDHVVSAIEARLHASLDLARAPLCRAALVSFGTGHRDHLILVVHHLLVDGVSWRILIEDLDRAYRDARAGRVISLPDRTTSFSRWAWALVTRADDPAVRAESSYWLAARDAHRQKLPLDLNADIAVNTRGAAHTITVTLDENETAALLREVPAAYRTQVNDVLLTAVLTAFEAWTGSPYLLVDLEGHGRDAGDGGLDASRTVGWFTTVFPVSLEFSPGEDPGAALEATKEQLRNLPRAGVGHGLLRYLTPDPAMRDALGALPRPEIVFNYLGQRGRTTSGPTSFIQVRTASASARSPREQRPYLLEIDAVVDEGRFRAEWTYAPALHDRATIERLTGDFARALRDLIAHCVSGARGVTPSDFPLANLDQSELDRLAGLIGDLDSDHDS